MTPIPVGTLWTDSAGRVWQVVANAREAATGRPVVVHRDDACLYLTMPADEFLRTHPRREASRERA